MQIDDPDSPPNSCGNTDENETYDKRQYDQKIKGKKLEGWFKLLSKKHKKKRLANDVNY